MRPRFDAPRGPSTPRGALILFWPDLLCAVQRSVCGASRWQTLRTCCADASDLSPHNFECNWHCCGCVAAYSEHLASCKALGSASASAREGYEGPRDVTSLSLSASLTGLLGSIPGGPLTAAVLLEA